MDSEDAPFIGAGWKQVDELPLLEDDEEYEEDEVAYVVFDMSNHLAKESLAAQHRIQIAGLTTPSPLLRIGPRVFEGKHEQLIGTEVIYQDALDPAQPPTLLAGTDQRINFSPVYLASRDLTRDPNSLEVPVAKDVGKSKGRGTKKEADGESQRGKRGRGRPRGSRGEGRGRGRGRGRGAANADAPEASPDSPAPSGS